MDNFEHGITRGVGEGSGNSYATTTNDSFEVVVDASKEPRRTGKYLERRMEKVPLSMRKCEKTKGYFDPRVISIGPYHHGKKELQNAERIKPIIAQLYILNSGRNMDEFRQNILGIVDVARSYYLEGSTDKYSDQEFAEMMLLDGLFSSAYIECTTLGYHDETIIHELKKHLGLRDFYIMGTDVQFLIENQLPLQVIELLMSLKSNNNNLTKILATRWAVSHLFASMKQDMGELNREIRELLDSKRIDCKKLLHYPELFWLQQNKFSESNHDCETSNVTCMWDSLFSFRSITELKAKGIYVRRSTVYDQRTIKFRPFFFFFGVLELSPVMVVPEFIMIISNQIAYEWTPNNPNRQPTMAYVNFMKSLISSAEDVKELRAKNIVFSSCTSDEEVVRMIDNIPTIRTEDSNIYGKVKRRIQNHYNNKAKTWIAELIHNYFNSPLAFITFLAATAVIIMSFLQTDFTINPSK
ncbi:hypothetical protein RHSIM_Rhsim02G0207900 [Rhododendron simsii]|uniref:Uncharacterized protein n=1 Tax=Rhododendron simsii TaxID=118357 RepID=A0A834HEM3_RHOSS|nr:hypothetical protein RHSIM_Rhsim02G0207900 [Rhododendron simsii]